MLKFIILLFYLFIIGCNSDDKVDESLSFEGGNEETLDICMDLIDFSTSTKQVFYAFHVVTLNGELIDDADWVAAFNGDVCVGHHQWTTGDCNNGTCTVVANGFDGTISTATQGYCESGDVPTFKIYDSSESKMYDTYGKDLSGVIIDTPSWNENILFNICDSLVAIPETGMDCSD